MSCTRPVLSRSQIRQRRVRRAQEQPPALQARQAPKHRKPWSRPCCKMPWPSLIHCWTIYSQSSNRDKDRDPSMSQNTRESFCFGQTHSIRGHSVVFYTFTQGHWSHLVFLPSFCLLLCRPHRFFRLSLSGATTTDSILIGPEQWRSQHPIRRDELYISFGFGIAV